MHVIVHGARVGAMKDAPLDQDGNESWNCCTSFGRFMSHFLDLLEFSCRTGMGRQPGSGSAVDPFGWRARAGADSLPTVDGASRRRSGTRCRL